jgi:hypothetical protein
MALRTGERHPAWLDRERSCSLLTSVADVAGAPQPVEYLDVMILLGDDWLFEHVAPTNRVTYERPSETFAAFR